MRMTNKFRLSVGVWLAQGNQFWRETRDSFLGLPPAFSFGFSWLQLNVYVQPVNTRERVCVRGRQRGEKEAVVWWL